MKKDFLHTAGTEGIVNYHRSPQVLKTGLVYSKLLFIKTNMVCNADPNLMWAIQYI